MIPSLLIVMMLAERLPVALIPEQLRITTVWLDMVYDCSKRDLSFLETLSTERMELQELLAFPSPPCVVATPCCRPVLFRVHRLVLLAVLLSGRHEVWTAWMSARYLWFEWHARTSFHKESPGGIILQGFDQSLHAAVLSFFFADSTLT
jgi:hypothetical protein